LTDMCVLGGSYIYTVDSWQLHIGQALVQGASSLL